MSPLLLVTKHGGRTGTDDRINLEKDEYIIGIDGCTGVNVDSIRIHTNKRVFGPFGKNGDGSDCYHFFREGHILDLGGWPHKQRATEHCHRGQLPADGEIIGFYGKVHAGDVITQIGVITRSIGHTQTGWHRCRKCSCLVHRENPSSCPGVCMAASNAGGPHDPVGSGDYELICHGSLPSTQPDFKKCERCCALFHSSNPSPSHCPVGGEHKASGSRTYSLYHDNKDSFGEDGWLWCARCGSIFHSETPGICPVGRAVHDGKASFKYKMMLR